MVLSVARFPVWFSLYFAGKCSSHEESRAPGGASLLLLVHVTQ